MPPRGYSLYKRLFITNMDFFLLFSVMGKHLPVPLAFNMVKSASMRSIGEGKGVQRQ